MKNHLSVLVLAITIFACQTKKQEATSKIPTLRLKWETDTLLTTNESVIYDEANNMLYVANINGAPDGKDGNGFVSKVSLEGKITELKWITGMDAPKGLGIFASKLYVADIDKVHEIDITAGKITATYASEGAKFLNDIAVGQEGKVYISDTGANEILVLEKGVLSKLLTNQPVPNGLFIENNTLLFALWEAKTLNSIDLGTKEVTLKTDSIDNPDGIEAVGDGGYFVSSWNGQITYVGSDWKNTLVLDTRADSVSAADIEYIASKKLLLVPTFFKNKVAAYEVAQE